VALEETLSSVEGPQSPSQLSFDIEMSVGGDVDRFDPEEFQTADLLGLPKVAEKRARVIAENNAGKGRPRGQHNRKTQAWVEHILRRYPSPLETLAQIQASPIDVLATELRCSRLEAMTQKRHAAEALAPFVHQKLTAVEVVPPPEPLHLVPQPGFPDYREAVVIEATAEGVETRSDSTTSEDEAANRSAAPLAERNVAGSSSSTLTLMPQEPNDPVEVEAVAVGDQVDTAVVRALDALEELMRGDPEQARQIRARMVAILG
jgi:hypothetical protein